MHLPVVPGRCPGHEELRGSQQLLRRLAGRQQRCQQLAALRLPRRAARPLLLRCGLAHALKPVIMTGNKGLTDALLKEFDVALAHHELVKVKFDDLKDQKKELAPRLAEQAHAHLVTRVGNVVVLYRPKPAQPVDS